MSNKEEINKIMFGEPMQEPLKIQPSRMINEYQFMQYQMLQEFYLAWKSFQLARLQEAKLVHAERMAELRHEIDNLTLPTLQN